jgi:uncharacterized protein (DUF305 family)
MTRQKPLFAVSLLLLLAALLLGACAGTLDMAGQNPSDEIATPLPEGEAMHDTMVDDVGFDQAFIDMMVPHHEGAVEMARIARERAEHPEIRQMADEIIGAQEDEITQLHDWREQWYGSRETPPLSEMPMLSGMPGMEDMPGTMDMAHEVERLRAAAEPFDLAFIDAMIAHHQDAIDAAEFALQQSSRQEIRDLAQAIIAAQRGEIEQLRAWRESWYPGAAPVAP